MSELSWVGIYGAALSTALLAWEILKHRFTTRPRAKLDVSFARTYSPMDEPSNPQVCVEIANIGAVLISIQEGGFLVSRKRLGLWRVIGKLQINPSYAMPLPHDLTPGKSFSLFLSVEYLLEKVAALEKAISLTHVYFRDATGRRYQKRLSDEFLDHLLGRKMGI